MKPMLASDYDESKLRFPLGAQPKIDGVRGHTPHGGLLARSNKLFANRYVTEFFSGPEYAYLDGELAAQDERHPELCRLTTSATSTITGQPFLLWHVFDFLEPSVIGLPYKERYARLKEHVVQLQGAGLAGHLRVVPMVICNTLEELLYCDQLWLEQGYEGTIIRDLEGKHKQGRSTVREQGLLRIKRFIEEEAVVYDIIEGQHNMNEAQTNELGKTTRSTHQENMVPNGQVGTLVCHIFKDSELFKQGDEIHVSPGALTIEERVYYFQNQDKIKGRLIKFKHFPKGVKDKPRFPNFVAFRSTTDM